MRQEIAKGIPLVRKDLIQRGFRGNTLSEMAKNGIVYRVGCGVYAPLTGSCSGLFDYELAMRAVPKGVFSLWSALRLHELTDINPRRMTMAIPCKAHKPKTTLPIDFVYMLPTLLLSDVVELTSGAVPIRVFSVERTLVECFKARNKIGIGICVDALKEAMSKGIVDNNALWVSMKRCRMTNVMAPYLEGVQ